MVNSEKFAERLVKIMEEYELNATAFADKIEVGRSSISHILSGRNKPSLEFVMKVVETFPEVELYWLLNGKGSLPAVKKNEQKESSDLFTSNPLPEHKQDSMKIPAEFSYQTSAHSNEPSKLKQIKRIVLFYNDGTFESFDGQLPDADT